MPDSIDIHDQVRQDYTKILLDPKNSILTGDTGNDTMSASVGYTPEELAQVPAEANLGLGCGNPHRAANLQPGEHVIDLGSGAGLDCFLAGVKVGRRGKAVGVDMVRLERYQGFSADIAAALCLFLSSAFGIPLNVAKKTRK